MLARARLCARSLDTTCPALPTGQRGISVEHTGRTIIEHLQSRGLPATSALVRSMSTGCLVTSPKPMRRTAASPSVPALRWSIYPFVWTCNDTVQIHHVRKQSLWSG